MSYSDIFAIAGQGMAYEQLRLDTVANNLANLHSIDSTGAPYQTLQVVATAKEMSFSEHLNGVNGGMESMQVIAEQNPAKMRYEPSNPYANAQGFVAYPNINKVDQMMTMMAAKRAYEADIKVINTAKSMALKALEIGDK